MTLENCTISNNYYEGFTGHIFMIDSYLIDTENSISNSKITNNTSLKSELIRAVKSKVVFKNTVISKNKVLTNTFTGLFSVESIINAEYSRFTDQTSIKSGVFFNIQTNSEAYFNFCSFENSVSLENGGAIYSTDSKLTISNSQFINNTAALTGGSIAALSSFINISRSTFISNQALNG